MPKYRVKFITNKRWHRTVDVESPSGIDAIIKVNAQVKAAGEIMNMEEAQFIQIT